MSAAQVSRIGVEAPIATDAAPRKIALLGSAPSSVHLAPYNDPSWTIWGCSWGAAPAAKRVDTWFELHPFSTPEMPREYMLPDYIAWMTALDKPIYVIDPVPFLPRSMPYPKAEMMAKYGPYFFTNSISWMFALALEQNPQEIGLWGVEMSATDEWAYQRPACHHFITRAQARGMKVTVPPQSDLLQPPSPYGFVMNSAMHKKLKVRATELDTRITQAAVEYENKRNEWHFLRGARDDLEYILNTWVE